MSAAADGPILITGAHGFLGAEVTSLLRRAGAKVYPTARWAGLGVHALDLADPQAVAATLMEVRPSAVIHCAATIAGSTATVLENGVGATSSLAAAALRAGVRRLVFCSSISVYGGEGPYHENSPTLPQEPYGWGKLAAEQALIASTYDGGKAAADAGEHPLEVVILRLSGIHGPGRKTGVVAAFLSKIAATQAPPISEPTAIIRPVFVSDAARACQAAVLTSLAGHETQPRLLICNIAGAEAVTLADLRDAAQAAWAGQADWPLPPMPANSPRNRDMTIDRAMRSLGYAPRPLMSHLLAMAEDLRQSAAHHRKEPRV